METILAQTVADWELIICDSYSEDGSWEFFQKFNDNPRIHLFQAPRAGTPGSWNYCLERAEGSYVYIATSDDTMSAECLERLLQPLERHDSLSLSVCDFDYIDSEGRILPLTHRPMEFIDDWTKTACVRNGNAEFLLHACFGPTWVTMTSVLFRRKLLDTTGLFPIDLGPPGDLAWAMRASLASDTAFVPGRLATWRMWEGQASSPIESRRALWRMMACVQSVTEDRSIKVPNHWKQIPDWRSAVTTVWAREYYRTFQLYRSQARRNPLGFTKQLLAAGLSSPTFLVRQALSGFRMPSQVSFNRVQTAKSLLSLFEAPWPPIPMSGYSTSRLP
jgi:glycosyltransferase involved in cell wall biosynthesis